MNDEHTAQAEPFEETLEKFRLRVLLQGGTTEEHYVWRKVEMLRETIAELERIAQQNNEDYAQVVRGKGEFAVRFYNAEAMVEQMHAALVLCANTLEGHLDEPQAVSHAECRNGAKIARAVLALTPSDALARQSLERAVIDAARTYRRLRRAALAALDGAKPYLASAKDEHAKQ